METKTAPAHVTSEELTCNVCLDVILPPINMCANHHNICQTCSEKLIKHAPHNCNIVECICRKVRCPVCRVDMKGTKLLHNTALEQRAKEDPDLLIPCVNQPACDTVLLYKDMSAHLATCAHAKKPEAAVAQEESDSDDEPQRIAIRGPAALPFLAMVLGLLANDNANNNIRIVARAEAHNILRRTPAHNQRAAPYPEVTPETVRGPVRTPTVPATQGTDNNNNNNNSDSDDDSL